MIAQKFEYIYFIEVKLRNFNSSYQPREAVDILKQKKIFQTAMIFLSKHKTTLQPKFAVIEILKKLDGDFFVNFLDDAFGGFDEFDLFKNF